MKSAIRVSEKWDLKKYTGVKRYIFRNDGGDYSKDIDQGLTVQWVFLPSYVRSSVFLITGFAYTALKLIFMLLVQPTHLYGPSIVPVLMSG